MYLPSRGSLVGIATDYELDGRGGRSSSPDRGKIFLLSTTSGSVLGPIQPPIQWVPGAKLCLLSASLIGLSFDPEDGGDMFLRNVG
jgi:hypothetical protein